MLCNESVKIDILYMQGSQILLSKSYHIKKNSFGWMKFTVLSDSPNNNMAKISNIET